jgi:hypothetical protein
MKPRINITTKPEIKQALRLSAKRDGISVTAKAAGLISLGLALEGDLALTKIANVRSVNSSEFITHDKA